MPAMPVYESDIVEELARRRYKPAAIHHIPTPPPEVHHPPPVEPPIHPPLDVPGRGLALLISLAWGFLGLTAFEEEE